MSSSMGFVHDVPEVLAGFCVIDVPFGVDASVIPRLEPTRTHYSLKSVVEPAARKPSLTLEVPIRLSRWL
jgi:hypothetical protein